MLTDFGFLTFHDVVDYTLDQCIGADYSPRNRRLAVEAVRDAYTEIPSKRNWRYYYRSFTLQTTGNQTDGTVAYDYTGGANERQLTLTSSTWPSDLTGYAVSINSVRYGIASRVSGTVITLREGDCPTADIASGTSYNLIKDTYLIPANCRTIFSLYDTNAPGRLIACVDPGDIIRERRLVRGSALPIMYSAFRGEDYAGSMAVHFAPSPSASRTYQCYALFMPEPLRVLDYSGEGTVAVSANGVTVTGTGTNFSSKHVGCVIRISDTGSVKIPTDVQGEVDRNRMEPYAIQRVIKSVESTTSLTLEVPSDVALTGSGFRISSRIDIETNSMRNAFLRCCEARFACQDRKKAEEREARYQYALVQAMYADQRVFETVGPTFIPRTLSDVAANITLSTGGV